ncbi:TetR family transcriptional regulator [Microbispora sp. NPDC046933]|uniref:TetR/AcrR family transcriptional regulator n=1 Tax=Microbispora sp. NPDC046933 TaxID=3155618 RepID=UPI0033C90371
MAFDRDHVLRCAADLLSRKATATQDEIAKAAGISRATLHRHFAGRDVTGSTPSRSHTSRYSANPRA